MKHLKGISALVWISKHWLLRMIYYWSNLDEDFSKQTTQVRVISNNNRQGWRALSIAEKTGTGFSIWVDQPNNKQDYAGCTQQ